MQKHTMDPNALVLEISSDEEGAYNHDGKGIIDGADDYNWISDILDEVINRDNCGYDNGGDDSDEVVVVSEVLPKKPRKKLTSKSSSLLDFDDDCVVLDHDPDKPPEPRKDKPIDRNEDSYDDDDSDDILVVSEKGQVACRDFPHSRHLCIKFPFSSTPNQSHCGQCYCYVCDSLAPCIYWGNGSGSIDHCLATDKDDFWILERKNSKKGIKGVIVPPMNPNHQTESLPTSHNQIPRPNPIRACPVTPNFGSPNIVNEEQNPLLLSRNRFHPGLVSQQLTRTSSCTAPRDRVHHNYNLSTSVHKPVFKRTASDGYLPETNRYSYNSYYRGHYRNHFTGSSRPNSVNTSLPFSPISHPPADFLQPIEIPDPYVEVPILFQPNLVTVPVPVPVPLSSQGQTKSSLPNYAIPSEVSGQESQRSTVDSKFFHGLSWPQSQMNHHHQPAAQSSVPEGVGSTNEPALVSGSAGLFDNEFDYWMFNNQQQQQPCEPRSMDAFGLREFSPDPAFVDSRTEFDY